MIYDDDEGVAFVGRVALAVTALAVTAGVLTVGATVSAVAWLLHRGRR